MISFLLELILEILIYWPYPFFSKKRKKDQDTIVQRHPQD